jgi:hypothetical protein
MTIVTGGLIVAVTIAFLFFLIGYNVGQRRAELPRTLPPRPAPDVPLPAWGMPQFPAQHTAPPQVVRTQERHLRPAPSIPAQAYTGRHHLETVATSALPTVTPTGKEGTP